MPMLPDRPSADNQPRKRRAFRPPVSPIDTSQQSPAVRNQKNKPDDEEVRFLQIGYISGAFGLGGELKVVSTSDFPERFGGLERVLLGEELRPYRVESAKARGVEVLLKLRGIDEATGASELRGTSIFVPLREGIPLEEGQFYWHQIIGMTVVTEEGKSLGEVKDILSTGANDVYVVHGKMGELLIPAIEDVIVEVSLEKREVVIHPLPGLLEP